MKEYMLEACADSVESACIATRNGARRIELCSNLVIGGTTPTLALFKEVHKSCSNVIHVLIRPRFGDFCYSNEEFEVIKEEIRQFRAVGADGVVIGFLKENGELDSERMKVCIQLAGNMKITLHRAFDVCRDPYETMEEAIRLKVHTILTSGQADNCAAGADCLRQLREQGNGRITILAGGGVKPENIRELYHLSGITDFHMSGKKLISSKMQYRKENVHMGTEYLSEYEIWQTDGENIKRAIEVLERILDKPQAVVL